MYIYIYTYIGSKTEKFLGGSTTKKCDCALVKSTWGSV